jgi:hypothetical protein
MLNEILARFQSEPGWKVVCHEGKNLTTHHVGGWALTSASLHDDILIKALPITLAGEILSDRPGFLGLIGPNDDVNEKLGQYSDMIK